MHTFALLFNIMLEAQARTIRQKKEIEDIQIEKKGVTLSLATDYRFLYVENPKEFTYTHSTVKAKKFNKFENTKSTHKCQLSFYSLSMNNAKKKI